jgi:hypothetical protein
MRIKLKPPEVRQALEFSWKICGDKNQVGSDFGRRDLPRSLVDQVADTTEGKLAELAFSKFAEKKYNLRIEVDFKIYLGMHHIDYGNDIPSIIISDETLECRSRVDIKATRLYSKWLLVERHKFWADAYIIVKVDLPQDIESNLDGLTKLASSSVEAEVCGFVYHFDLIDSKSNEPWFVFRKGEKLFDPVILKKISKKLLTSPVSIKNALNELSQDGLVRYHNCYLKAKENFGVPIELTRKSKDEWNAFFCWIKGSSYKNEKEGLALKIAELGKLSP